MLTNKRTKQLKEKFNSITNQKSYSFDSFGRAIIDVGAENYDDVFSRFCYKGGDTLSSNLVQYLMQKSNTIPLKYDLTIRFHIKNADEQKRQEIQTALKQNYETDIQGLDNRMHKALMFSLWFILLGSIFSLFYLFTLENVPVSLSYIVDLLAWVFLWEGIDAFFLDRNKMKLEKLKALRLGSANIEIKEFELY